MKNNTYMDKLIEIEGKFYKRCGVVMLKTTQEKAIGLCLRKDNNKLLDYPITESDHNQAIYQHLYILSDDEIKEGDNAVDNVGRLWINIESCFAKVINEQNKNGIGCKIIASTDPSLNLAPTSNKFIQSYIEAYNQGTPINKVLVEVERYISSVDNSIKSKLKLKKKKKNIILKGVKDIWSTNELECKILDLQIAIAKSILDGNTFQDFDVNKWMEENLLI